ncbi:hypothetical protein EI555_007094 [Monodon monoceros]|uniref:CSD domain-containing protein n=1 Tax=Monodon monoceros TaxID=40151 RepID=A0A4U1FFG2_MONMO|nr:hypothetical protein EI555_007094 [Monodon monoceros]
MSSETQQPPAAPALSTADPEPGLMGSGAGSGGPGDLTLAVPNGGDKVIATKVLGTVKWFNVRNGYGFTKRNDTKEDVFVHQTAIKKKNPRKYLRSIGDRETVEFDVVEGEKDAETANVTGPCGVPAQGGTCAPDRNHYRRSPHRRGLPLNHQQNYQNSCIPANGTPYTLTASDLCTPAAGAPYTLQTTCRYQQKVQISAASSTLQDEFSTDKQQSASSYYEEEEKQ